VSVQLRPDQTCVKLGITPDSRVTTVLASAVKSIRLGACSLLPPTHIISANGQASRATIARANDNPNRRAATTHHSCTFAHPAEVELAALFSRSGIRWHYEPRSFPLEIGATGRVVRSFTPDFFLPDDGIYIEMTTMRQSLVTRKNQKFRQMKALYPEVNVKLLYRKDLELILSPHGTDAIRFCAEGDPIRMTADQIEGKAIAAARAIAAAAAEQSATLLATANGRRFAEQISQHTNADLRELKDISTADDALHPNSFPVIVTGALGTGLELRATAAHLLARGAVVVTLVDRPGPRLFDLPVIYAGIQVSAEWLVGCGLGGDNRADVRSVSLPPRSLA
jgi:hypothetical protein